MAATTDAIVASLAAWRGRHLRPTWRAVIATDAYSWQTVNAQFGGIPLLKADEDWPVCPECRRPMNLMIQLDLAHLPHGLHPARTGLLQYFQCMDQVSCSAAVEDFQPFNRGELVRIVAGGSLRTPIVPPSVDPYPARVVARWSPFYDLPATAEHERLGLEYRYEFLPDTRAAVAWPAGGLAMSEFVEEANDDTQVGLAEAIADAAPGDKIGGWPRWVQDVEYPSCRDCGSAMRYLLQLDSHDNIPDVFGDMGTRYLAFCPSHPSTLTCTMQCS